MFSLKCDEGIDPKNFKANSKVKIIINYKVYMDPYHFLTLDRFLPKPKGEKQPRTGGSGFQRGGSFQRGGFRGAPRGGSFRGAPRGGNFRGAPRGGNFRRGG